MKLKSLILAVLLPAAVFAAQPKGFVTDEAGVLGSSAVQLESNLRAYEKATTIEIAVVTVPSLGGVSVEEYANRLFHSWGIGKKGTNNGVLVLVAVKDHKTRIEVGYGLESKLNDAAAGDIIRDQMIPAFKQGNFAVGVTNAVNAIEQRLK